MPQLRASTQFSVAVVSACAMLTQLGHAPDLPRLEKRVILFSFGTAFQVVDIGQHSLFLLAC